MPEPLNKAVSGTPLAMEAEKSHPIDEPMAVDVQDICQAELKRFNSNADLKPSKLINREKK